MDNNGQGSWKCGGCGTWYAYWVFKCECEKVSTGEEETAVAGAPTEYWIPVRTAEELRKEFSEQAVAAIGKQVAAEMFTAMAEALESA